MPLREWINNNNALVTMLTIVVLCVALALVVWYSFTHQKGRELPSVWYYDTVTGELLARPVTLGSPTVLPNGHMAYQANVYSCGDCGDPDKRHIISLRREANATLTALREQDDAALPDLSQSNEPSFEVIAFDKFTNDLDDVWINDRSATPQQTAELQRIDQLARTVCDGEPGELCNP